MAYTIIEVERKTGVASRTLRFWADKGLFPFVQKDSNGVRYFSEKDVQWVFWIDCYRQIGMSIEDIKHYITLCAKGESSAQERLEIIQRQRQKTLDDIEKLQVVLEKLDYKVAYYKEMIAKQKDDINPLNQEYVKRPLMIGKKHIRSLAVKIFTPFNLHRNQEDKTGKLRPNLSGVIAPEVSVAQPTPHHRSKSRQKCQHQKDGKSYENLINNI